MNDLLRLSGVEIARLIKTSQVSATDVMEQALHAADQAQAKLNPFVTLRHDAALAEAKAADQRLQASQADLLPTFFGVPFTVKDLLNTKGIRTTYGSRSLDKNIPNEDVVAVARMKAAGGILLGKTTTPEFASKVTTDSELCGITRNPWAPELSPGGSSGGDCVAIASGVVPFGVSTDGGGSSRIPAATCGLLGMKVTIGAIPHESWPFHYGNNSSISMNCRSPQDLVGLFNTMSGEHSLDPWSRRKINPLKLPDSFTDTLKNKRAIFIPALGGNTADAQYLTIVEAALASLQPLGLAVETASTDPTAFNPNIATSMIVGNLAARVRQMPQEAQQHLGAVLRGLLNEDEFKLDGIQIQTDAMHRSQTYDRLEQLLANYDFVFTPTLTAPPPLADPERDQRITVNGEKQTIDKWWTHLSIANLTGHPAISVPCGKDANGLPVGLHAIGRWDHEQDLVNLACAVSTFNNWKEWKSPSLS